MEVAHSTIRKNKAIVGQIETIDWEQRRYEIAKMAMAGLLSAPITDGMIPPEQTFADWSVKYADALIEELKKEKKNEL